MLRQQLPELYPINECLFRTWEAMQIKGLLAGN